MNIRLAFKNIFVDNNANIRSVLSNIKPPRIISFPWWIRDENRETALVRTRPLGLPEDPECAQCF